MRNLTMLLVIAAAGIFFAGCATSSGDYAADAASSASQWSIRLSGKHEVWFSERDYEETVTSYPESYRELSAERRGVSSVYQGLSLSRVLSLVDSLEDAAGFNLEQWEEGYEITLTASDGYSVTFLSSDYSPDNFLVYNRKDGEKLTPGIIAENLPLKYHIDGLVGIAAALDSDEEEQPFYFEVFIHDSLQVFSVAELEQSPFFYEGPGGYTTSSGTYYEHIYGGILLGDFIRSLAPLEDDHTVTLEAMDGYRMTYSGEDILNQDDGIWLLAFYADGRRIPLDPGYLRGVKVAGEGQAVPNIHGHTSPRMVKAVELKPEVLRDFSLSVTGKMDHVITRSDLEAAVSCEYHRRDVSYFHARSGEVEHYTGIALFEMLSFSDDPSYAPHRQEDRTIESYNREAALAGYQVVITAGDGFSITLDSRELDENRDVILAMYRDGNELEDPDWPLKVVWDMDASVVPAGIRAVRNVVSIELVFPSGK